jgi:hypothetical protein
MLGGRRVGDAQSRSPELDALVARLNAEAQDDYRIALPRPKPGVIIPTVYADTARCRVRSSRPLSAGHFPRIASKAGVIMEAHDKAIVRAREQWSTCSATRFGFAARRSASYPSSPPSIRSNAHVARSLR